MKRLTKWVDPAPKNDCFPYSDSASQYTTKDKKAAINKLGVLEDIEEKFEIDLSIMFKAMKNGINTIDGYIPPHDLIVWKGQLYRKPMGQPFHTDMFPFWKYGEDWALTKEELEEGK